MNKVLTLISGIGLGTGLMYLFDPDKGKRRRAQIRDKTVHGLNKANDAINKTSRDMSNRAQGLMAEAKAVFKSGEATDARVVARVRSKLGRRVSHPGAVEVAAEQGRVTLTGHVLASEVANLINCVSSVPGVSLVDNKLEVHEEAGNVPALQGGWPRTGARFELAQENWSPTVRLLVGAAGGALTAYGANRRGALGAATGALGVGLLTRSLTNIDIGRLIGIGDNRGIEIQKTITVNAPVGLVFELWSHHEYFPRFMSRVREVKKIGEGRYHWTVAGPAGVPVEWEGEITRLIPNELIEWKSIEGSAIEQEGRVRFREADGNGTCIDIKMSYNPPAGAIGHAIATMFGADPKREMDEDLMRMKSFIETGHLPHDAAEKRASKASAH
ncbi:MAG: BON domain-containing protein [Blastocatellia bacterium]|nr:BON domain-containing protein [Blastocatellia bacterium]